MSQVIETIMHEVRESFIMALVALRVNKLRSILTLLGIAVGVFSIIGVMTGMGVLINSIESGLSQLGANTFQVQRMPNFRSGNPAERAKLRNISDGRLFTLDEYTSGKKVAILGTQVVKKIFPKIDPVGQSIRFDGEEYRVIGTIEPKGGILGGNMDNFIAIPLTTFFDEYGKDRDIHIMVEALSRETFDDCIEQVRGILRTARHVAPGVEDDFYYFSNDSMIEQFNDFIKYTRLGILLISTIALIAAGVGIMNIMLVSVTERTREIGIRKAIGAKKTNILAQFILEAVVLSELGGLIGILLGISAGNILAIVFEVRPVIPWDWVTIGFVACSLIGITFGVYPAWKASSLDPIESLRYE
ncbi:MAG: ABC transporter permease [Ignavibacteriales bacterium]|nr:ABC transporter permease [Ignavibacteriales bacterium]